MVRWGVERSEKTAECFRHFEKTFHPTFQVKPGTLRSRVNTKSLGTFYVEACDVDLGYSTIFARRNVIITRNDKFHFRPPIASNVAKKSNETSSDIADDQVRSRGTIWVLWKRHWQN